MIKVAISIGSNCGDRIRNVENAIVFLQKTLIDVRVSEIYETPCALKAGLPYMNAVMEGVYQGTGFELEDLLKEEERKMGRSSSCKEKGEVPIDLDIVVCDGEVWKQWDFRQKFFRKGFDSLHQ